MNYAFMVNIPEQAVEEVSVIDTTLLRMSVDKRFNHVLGLYREGLVEIEYEKSLRHQIYRVRFQSNQPLLVKNAYWARTMDGMQQVGTDNGTFPSMELVTYNLT
jgi:hypothetical protein